MVLDKEIRMKKVLAIVGLLFLAGSVSAQCCVANAIVAQPIYAQPLVSYAPVVQLQQVVQAAPVVQQQVQQVVAPAPVVQQVVVPTVPVLNFVQQVYAQPLVANVVSGYHSQAIVGVHHGAASIVNVAPFNHVRQAIVVNQRRAAAIVVAPRRAPLVVVNGRRR
jgi:hypothetical protein